MKIHPVAVKAFHVDEKPDAGDVALGSQIAQVIGDTQIEFLRQTSGTQWAVIVHALRFHGLQIVDSPKMPKSGIRVPVVPGVYKTRGGKTAVVESIHHSGHYRDGYVQLKTKRLPTTWNPDGTKVCYQKNGPNDLAWRIK